MDIKFAQNSTDNISTSKELTRIIIMGMAASQARFLGLTARKTNVEYQGQQVNQQRAALANESAGLYNSMMGLKVPLPPSAVNYYSSRYTFESTAENSNFSISAINPAQNGQPGVYDLTIQYNVDEQVGFNKLEYPTSLTISTDPATGDIIGTPRMSLGGSTYTGRLVASNEANNGPIKAVLASINEGRTATNKAQATDLIAFTAPAVSGQEAKTYYVLKEDAKNFEANGKRLNLHYSNLKTVTKTISATAAFEADDKNTSRYSKMILKSIDNKDKAQYDEVKKLLGFTEGQDKILPLEIKKVNDETGLDAAMQQYEYEKMLYERSIQDINAKTEVVQQQDKNLELKLRQIDTEQKALQTEMEAVQKVIQKNVETTFKTFG